MDLSKILFLDIETIPQYEDMKKSPEDFKKLWEEKAKLLARQEADNAESLFDRAGIYAEFGRIVCISVGFISHRGSLRELRIKSYYGDDEKILLDEFAALLNKHFNQPDHLLCAHNGKEFDYPYIARRMIITGVKVPRILDSAGKKPWEMDYQLPKMTLMAAKLHRFIGRKKTLSV
jgi:predicted PolB exonuclease-like 3'-5' exonuclease